MYEFSKKQNGPIVKHNLDDVYMTTTLDSSEGSRLLFHPDRAALFIYLKKPLFQPISSVTGSEAEVSQML